MNLTFIGFGAVIVVAGVLFAVGKLLPKAWKEMSEEEKSKVRIKPLCINVGVMIILCGALLLLRGFWEAFAERAFIISVIVWLAIAVLDVIYISKSKRYRNE